MRDASGVSLGVAAPASAYRTSVLVRFAHCDPAGIVFFPRYMEMFNNLVEDWCREELGLSFAQMHLTQALGLSTVHLEVDFVAPSVLGDTLSASLAVRALGKSSVHLSITLCGADGGDRVRGQMILVLVDGRSKRARLLPDDLRARMTVFQAES
jgi:4-hydroxybenzoyl-CoA thioesterase